MKKNIATLWLVREFFRPLALLKFPLILITFTLCRPKTDAGGESTSKIQGGHSELKVTWRKSDNVLLFINKRK